MPVAGLTTDDLAVYEDGVRQRLSFVTTHRIPLDVALVFDTSASMSGEVRAVQKSGSDFIRSLGSTDRIALLELKQRVNILQPLTQERSGLERALTGFTSGGSTALYDGLYVALAELTRTKDGQVRSRVLTVITDGADTGSLLPFDQLLDQARRTGVTVYVIHLKGKQFSLGLTKAEMKGADRAISRLADETGGQVLAAGMKRLGSVCGTIAMELSNRYTIGYISTNVRRDGEFRRVRVNISHHPDFVLRTRSGYIAASECAQCSLGVDR